MPGKFLTAFWKNLVMINYEVDPILLMPYVPPKTELDLFNGKCYISLVGFMFLNTKVLGISWPFHKNFEEVNLRFYVKHKSGNEWRRGVVFIKEIVPKSMITIIANSLYNENYATMPMKHSVLSNKESMKLSYSFKKNKQWHAISVEALLTKNPIQSGSKEEFITEHYWGYTSKNNSKTYEYAVEHPKWDVHEVLNYKLTCDFKEIYGKDFAFLSSLNPDTVFMASGSEITVRKAKII